MENMLLKELFVPATPPEEVVNEEMIILLHFHCGSKFYVTTIELVKEIVDFPDFIPLPGDTRFLGVFNLRGTIVPIFDPFNQGAEENKNKRLIVFEVEKGELVAVPTGDIFKNEIEQEILLKHPAYVTVDSVPYERFDITQILKESV